MNSAQKGKNKIQKLFQLVLVACCLIASAHLSAQEKKVDKYGRNIDDLTQKKRGPNLDRYGHLFLGYGFITGGSENDSVKSIDGRSSTFMLGYLWKWRVSKWYELGFSATYHYSAFHLKQDSLKIVPSPDLHKREKIVLNNIQLAPFQRFKLTNRHHSTGTFIDLGGFAGYHYRTKHQTREPNLTPGASRTRTVNFGLKYIEDFSYGVLARVGFNRMVFYGRYRFSDHFTEASGLPELPRFELGFRVGIHQ